MLAIVMCDSTILPSAEMLQTALARREPNARFASADGDDAVVLGFARKRMISFARVAARCPIGANELCVKSAWHWPDAQAAVASHKSHMLLSVAIGEDPRDCAALLGQCVASAVRAAGNAVAVHWQRSDSLWPADIYAKTIDSADPKRLTPFCIAVKLGRSADGLGAATKGLEAFGLKEIELRGFHGDPGELAMTLQGIGEYQVVTGNVIGDGQTVDGARGARLTARVEPSSFSPGTTCLRLYDQ
jgi:hypothetical protein